MVVRRRLAPRSKASAGNQVNRPKTVLRPPEGHLVVGKLKGLGSPGDGSDSGRKLTEHKGGGGRDTHDLNFIP